MLKTPKALMGEVRRDPILEVISGSRGNNVRILEEGVVQIGHFSLDILLWGRNAPEMYMGYPQLTKDGEEEDYFGSYGVCDSPEQFLKKYKQRLVDDPREFVVSFTHIEKDTSHAGQGGGWRWHKWGAYVGEGQPTMEYLDDEEGFNDGVYVYHVYQTGGPNLNKW